jgi:hypothetical protein
VPFLRLRIAINAAEDEETPMRAALLTFAVLGSQLTIPIAERLPELNVEKLCKFRSAGDKLMRQPESQSVPDCVRDETTAKQDLIKIWGQTDSSIRARCLGEAAVLGTRSYLDFLSCLQLADDTKSAAKATNQNRTRK